jgi:hypothetical protein
VRAGERATLDDAAARRTIIGGVPLQMIPIAELVLLPFEGTPATVVQMLAGELRARGVPTRIDAPVPLPRAAYDPARGQYRAESLLALASEYGAHHTLAITQRDAIDREAAVGACRRGYAKAPAR